MTSEQRDPREAVVEINLQKAWRFGANSVSLPSKQTWEAESRIVLEKIDAADPLRAILPDVVEALEELSDDMESELAVRYPPATRAYPSMESRYQRDMEPVRLSRALLTKLRTFHPATGGTEDDS